MVNLNTIYNEDCLEGIKKIPNHSINLIVTDPPYFTGLTHGYSGKARLLDLQICKPFYLQLFKEFNRVLTDKGCLYWFCDWRSQGFYLSAMEEARTPVKNCLVWNKLCGAGNFYTNQHEMILFATFNNKFACKGAVNVIDIPGFTNMTARKTNGDKTHPSQKPIEIIEKLIKDGSNEGDVVLDCFMGSGTTAVACINLNRRFIGFELDDVYFNIACRRVEEAKRQLL